MRVNSEFGYSISRVLFYLSQKMRVFKNVLFCDEYFAIIILKLQKRRQFKCVLYKVNVHLCIYVYYSFCTNIEMCALE